MDRVTGSRLVVLACAGLLASGRAHADEYEALEGLAKAALKRLATKGNPTQSFTAQRMLAGQPTQSSFTLAQPDGAELHITPVFSSSGYEGYKVAKTHGDTWISIAHHASGGTEKTRGWISKSTQWSTKSALSPTGVKTHSRIGYSSLGLWNLEVANGGKMKVHPTGGRKR